jgi:peptidoglycan hydrolase CwlO-like protein
MELMSFLTFIGGAMLTIIGYFLKKTMDELKEVKQLSYDNKSKLDVLQVDYKNKIENITEKFDELKLTMSELIKEIKQLNSRIR